MLEIDYDRILIDAIRVLEPDLSNDQLAQKLAEKLYHRHNGVLDGTVFLHGTSDALLPSIRENGLLPGTRKGADAWAKKIGKKLNNVVQELRSPSIFMTKVFDNARYYAGLTAEMNGGKPVVLRIDFPEDWIKFILQDELDSQGWRIPKIVLPVFIKEVMEVT